MATGSVFPVGLPASEEDVLDREAFLADLVQRLAHGNSVVLAAPRRLGKTSVAHEALRLMRQEGHHTAALDLSTTPTVEDMAERLIAGCLAAVEPAARTVALVRRGLARLMRIPEVRARLYDLEVSFALNPAEKLTPDDLLAEALGLPERIAAKDGRGFVVLLDEFQSSAAFGGSRLLAQMRGSLQLQHHTAWLFIGSQAGVMTQLFGARQQPFFRFATMLDLPPVPDEAWRAYIAVRFAQHGIGIADDAIRLILEYTGGHPYDTMQVAWETFLLARQRGAADETVVRQGCAEASRHLGPVFEAELDAAGARARTVLARIANGAALYGAGEPSSSLAHTVKSLVRSGLLRQVGRGRYEFTEPMMVRHLLGWGSGIL